MSYGTGQVAGSIVQDNIVVAGLSLVNHVFGVASKESIDFASSNTPFDGLMGLAQSVRISCNLCLHEPQTDSF